MADAAYYRELLSRRLRGRKVIIAFGQVAMLRDRVATLRELGAADVFALAEGIGVGELDPADADFPWRAVGPAHTDTIMDSIRGFDRALADLPADAVAALDAFDPDRSALVLRSLWWAEAEVAGRTVWGPRQPAWVRLEEKTTIDPLWDRAGVARAPSQVVAADRAALAMAAAALDQGAGTVWAGDNREGWHGAGEYTRWVPDAAAFDDAADFFAAHCDRVRVMPFLDGVPCSIHGIVCPDHVVALRPVEAVTLRVPGQPRLRYCSCSTTWDPPDADRASMRAMVRRVGALLRDEVGFRGTFTIDGVMTAGGFRPTELNPRFGAGLAAIARGVPELPVYFLDMAIADGEPWELRGRELEQLLLSAADANRVGGCTAHDPSTRDETVRVELVEADGGYRRAAGGEPPDAVILVGPAMTGSFLRFALVPERAPIGPSVAPRAVAALAFADRELGTSFGPLAPAPSLR